MNQVYILSASAGSGKTHALAKQYIKLLLTPPGRPAPEGAQALREILAITFTNKASHQMKARILGILKKIALDRFLNKDERDDILAALGDRDLRGEALEAMNAIIRNYHFFAVETIDSFIKSILSGCALKTDFSSGFRISEDYSENLLFSLDKLIETTKKDRGVLNAFLRFLDQYLYVENRAGWFLKRDILFLMDEMFYFANIYGRRFRKSDLKSADIIIKKKEVLRLIRELNDRIPEGADRTFARSLLNFLGKAQESFDIDIVPPSFGRADFPVNKGYDLPANVQNAWRKIRKSLKEICEMESVSIFNPYIDIFDMALDIFKNKAQGDDTIFLEELNRYARELFDRNSIPPGEIYYRLATRFRHYLIDEFQDTSILQWKNLIPLIEEALSTGGTFYCVGDKKQAIYRFRGGQSSLLDNVEERFKKFNVRGSTLVKNFRSCKEIVEFTNRIFSEENLERFLGALSGSPSRQEGVARFTPSETAEIRKTFQDSRQQNIDEKSRGFIRIEYVDIRDPEERENTIEEKTVSLIGSLIKRFSYKDIAILVRDNNDVELVTGWLLENEIPVESEKTLDIKEHPCIKELVSFLRFLSSPIDNMSFSSFILGDIFAQASGLDTDTMRSFIFSMRESSEADYFYIEFRKRYPEVWDNLIDEFFKNVGYVPLYEFTISILERFSVAKRFPQYQGFVMKFLGIIKEQEETNTGIPLFLEFFESFEGDDLYVDIVDPVYVKVLTIHKSKGLEFPVVIVPLLDIDVKIGGRRNFVLRYPSVEGPEDSGMELRRLKKKYNMFSENLNGLYREEYKKSFMDELNNIYVVFTRAKDELYIFIPERTVGKNISLSLLPIDKPRVEFGSPVAGKETEGSDKRQDMIKIVPSEYKGWMLFLKDEFGDIDEIKKRDVFKRGEILHYILSFIGNLSCVESGDAVKAAIKKACLKFPLLDEVKEVEDSITRIIKDKRLKEFFFIEKADVYQEKDIVNIFGETWRMDRLIVKEDAVEVIDYKSSREGLEDARNQVIRYVKAVRDMYPGRRVKGYIVFLDEVGVEEIYAESHNL